jgi:hypothetical protein
LGNARHQCQYKPKVTQVGSTEQNIAPVFPFIFL